MQASLPRIDECGGLRVVNDHKFGVEPKAGAVPFVVGKKNLKILRRAMVGLAVQGVVERFGDVEEFFGTLHHLPADAKIEFFRKRHEAIEDFRNAASHGGGVDHLDAAASQRFGQGAQFLDLACADHLRIVLERNAIRRQYLRHAFLLSRSIRRSILARALSSVSV